MDLVKGSTNLAKSDCQVKSEKLQELVIPVSGYTSCCAVSWYLSTIENQDYAERSECDQVQYLVSDTKC